VDEYKGYRYTTALKKMAGHVQAELFYYAPGGQHTGAGGTYFKTAQAPTDGEAAAKVEAEFTAWVDAGCPKREG
jgi:hypothetical protein